MRSIPLRLLTTFFVAIILLPGQGLANTTGLLGPGEANAVPLEGNQKLSSIQALDELSELAAVVVSGGAHTCALTTGGGVKCWGWNDFGQLGDGTTNNRLTPVDVVGLTSGVAAISADYYHTCALTSSGGVKCWGWNEDGQLGDGTRDNRLTPVDVVGLSSGVAAISIGLVHTCALTTVGGMKCWGSNWAGQLGDGTTDLFRLTPVDVVGLTSGVAAISARYNHTCALTTGGGAKCWGWNEDGQLGDGTTDDRLTPVDVVGLASGVEAISAGEEYTCVLMTGSGIKCWGDNQYGQLGDRTNEVRLVPVDVADLTSGIDAISTGGVHTCALTTSGGVKCWGNNSYSQLGDGTMEDRLTPVDVVGLEGGEPTAEPIQNPVNGHYYQLVEVDGDGIDWYAARDAAGAMEYNEMSGHLATVTSFLEEEFIVANFPEIYPEYVWLGASDEANEGDWQWITSEAWDYTDWADGEPNGGTYENCLDYGDYSSQWNDENCDRKIYYYLVEYSPTCVTIQRGSFGEVADTWIWEAKPDLSMMGYAKRLYSGFKLHPTFGLGEARPMLRFDLGFLPPGSTVHSATLGLYIQAEGSGEPVGVYRVTQPWGEYEADWNAFSSAYDTSSEWGSFNAQGPGYATTDLTDLVATWASGAQPNNGMMLINNGTGAQDGYSSSEWFTDDLPWLEVCYFGGAP